MRESATRSGAAGLPSSRVRALVVVVIFAACNRQSTPIYEDAYVALDAPAHQGAGPGGGLLDELRFAVVGDTRPMNLDDTANYPADVLRQIWTEVEAEQPKPAFA